MNMTHHTISDHNKKWELPVELQFETELIDTDVSVTKKLVKVFEDGTYEPGAYVGTNQGVKSHPEFFGEINKSLRDKLPDGDLNQAHVLWQHGYNGLFVVMDMRFPTICNEYDWFGTKWKKSLRLIIVRSINGSVSTSAFFGDIDWFCLNTLISGNFESIKVRNTSNFNPVSFSNRIPELKNTFIENAFIEQEYTKIIVQPKLLDNLFSGLFPDEKNEEGELKKNGKKQEFYDYYEAEAKSRGQTLYSVLSAFSQYSAHKPLRKTKSVDKWTTVAVRNHVRELDVCRMMSGDEWFTFLDAHKAPIYQH